MLLETTIIPRRDGCVIARMPDNTAYTFKPGEDGTLSCDVNDDAHVAWLVGTGNFYPANQADFDTVAEMVANEGYEGDKGNENDEDDGYDYVDENAPPIEEPAMHTRKKKGVK